MPDVTTPAITAAELHGMIDDGREFALLDVREEADFVGQERQMYLYI